MVYLLPLVFGKFGELHEFDKARACTGKSSRP